MSQLDKYAILIKSFVDGDISAVQFESQYLDLFKSETEKIPSEEFSELNLLFTDVDSFCDDPELRDDDELDQIQLRACAERTLNVLEKRE